MFPAHFISPSGVRDLELRLYDPNISSIRLCFTQYINAVNLVKIRLILFRTSWLQHYRWTDTPTWKNHNASALRPEYSWRGIRNLNGVSSETLKPVEIDNYHAIDVSHMHNDLGAGFKYQLNKRLNITGRRTFHEAHLNTVPGFTNYRQHSVCILHNIIINDWMTNTLSDRSIDQSFFVDG